MTRNEQSLFSNAWQPRTLEVNGGQVFPQNGWRFLLPATTKGYADAQIDDYSSAHRRRAYPWQCGVSMTVQARFSHPAGVLTGTAGFGFWNAPFGDPTIRWPALPQAVWFFYASAPTDLPLAPSGPGRGWFAATLDATTLRALSLLPLVPFVLALNQSEYLRTRIWPYVQQQLGVSFAPLAVDMTTWHIYMLHWRRTGCLFYIDDDLVLQTPYSPRGPLGFVCWLDNQYMVVTANGRFAWGTLPTATAQTLEVRDLQVRPD